MARLPHLFVIALLGTFFSPLVAAELVLSAPPRESREVAEKTFGPLASYLSEQLGQPVVYHQPESWAAYTVALRNGEYDFVFDGPHFAAWRMVHLKHQPMVKLPGVMRFVVVTSMQNGQLTKLTDLRSGTLCAMASPNLSTNAVLAEFGAVSSPDIVVVEGGYEGIAKAYEAGGCDAMLLRDSFYYEKVAEEKRRHLKIIYTSPAFSNQTLTAGTRVAREKLDSLAAALVNERGTEACSEIIKRFADKNAKGMALATAEEFKGNHLLLEGVVWGW